MTTYAVGRAHAGHSVVDRPWVIRDGPALGILTATGSPLADRLHAGSRVLVAAGPRTPSLRARAAFLDEASSVGYRTALIDKYGLAAVAALARSRMRYGPAGTVGVRLVLGAEGGGALGEEWEPSWVYWLN
ncbi:PPOX class F420-dependent oxidoreductase [Streptomyces sp. NPDC006530]|uniref:PPOX class F420-dependent oxidoreductase n=1 Tax=Streptomyces sp. NPDC006530 TaxID=3364750 RepID=UPI0036D19438